MDGGLHENAQIVNDLLLSGKAVEHIRSQGVFKVPLGLGEMGSVRVEVTVHRFVSGYKDTTFVGNLHIVKKMYLCSLNY